MRRHPLDQWELAQIDDEVEREYVIADAIVHVVLVVVVGLALLVMAAWWWI